MWIRAVELSDTSTVACTWVTGTASAGCPYTTACSPKRMTFPGAEELDMMRGRRMALGIVEDNEHNQRPERHAHLEGPVAEQDLLGRAACVLNLDQVQVPEDGIDHERDGQHHGVVGWQVGGRECVKRVSHHGGAGYDQDVLVEQRQGIAIQHLAVRAGILCKQGDL